MEDQATLQSAVSFNLNGEPVLVEAPFGERLSESLRERCGARDVKIGCNAGDCGACTVLLDGAPVCACLTPTHQVADAEVETPAGLARIDRYAQRLTTAFARHGAAQCGICTPGMLASAVALLRAAPSPTLEEVQDALGGVLCRCTGYRSILDAVVAAGQGEELPVAISGGVGAASARVDGVAKLSGAELFGDDVAPAGAPVVKVLRSPYPRAAFTLGDLDAFIAQTPGLICVLTAADVPGENSFGVIPGFEDQPVFAESEVRFRGEAVAAFVGEAEAMRSFDPDTAPIEWREASAVMTITEACAAGTPHLHAHASQNVMCQGYVACGDAEAGLAAADVVVEGAYSTSFVEHAYIEPEAGFARVVDGRIEIASCTQAPFMDLEAVARILDVSPQQVRILPTAVGGGFGSKLDLSVQPYLALAALKTGRPVRMAYSRQESMQSTTKRHPAEIRLRIGATSDGRVCGFDFEGGFNTGAYASWGPTVANRVPVHASGPYYIQNYRARSRAIYTHCPPSGAFRGFGVPQSAIAQETLFDQLAAKLDLDPLEFRLMNALDNGVRTVTGQSFDTGVGVRACLKALAPKWRVARDAAQAVNAARVSGRSPLRRGVGLAAGWYGCGNTSMPNPSTIKAGITPDGALTLHLGAVDIGQGSHTVIAQIFAEAIGVALHDLSFVGADTDITPDAGKTSASRQTFISGNAARLTGEVLREKVLRLCNASGEATLEILPGSGRLQVLDGAQRHEIALREMPVDSDGYALAALESYDPPIKPLDANGQGDPYAQFGYAAQIAEVDVDMTLGLVTPVKFIAAHDVGRAINPMLVEGQVTGGVAQGLGMALMEEFIPGRSENLHEYLIPTIGDMPEVETIIIEEADAHGPYGAKGLGEHVLIPTAPALFNAIRHASGACITRAPATPDRVLAAINAAREA
ncbi:MAG: molybdopterin-dependent oxidoreductase [Rhodobacteraceae bacterium]|nr:molybdopterin-dependent oxidoreductase [Paracoccaceae bacterium]